MASRTTGGVHLQRNSLNLASDFRENLDIEVDSDIDGNVESDSGVDSDNDDLPNAREVSPTTTVTTSVFNFTYADGRRYHADRYRKADYFLPNDSVEQHRLDLFHHMFLLLLGGRLYIAPLERPSKIMDVGTGTGIWAIDMADEHPQAEVIGTDISPIQPNMVPQNCRFELDDMEDAWTYPKNHFDFVHMRCMSGSFQDWGNVLEEVFDHLQPGGIFEFQDYGCEGFFDDGRPIQGIDTPVARYMDLIAAAAFKLGRPLRVAQTMKALLIKTGFEDVTEQKFVWPLGSWPRDAKLKTLGKWNLAGAFESVETFGIPLFRRGLGWSRDHAKSLCDEVKMDLSRGSPNRYYFQAWFVWGRKPRTPVSSRPVEHRRMRR